MARRSLKRRLDTGGMRRDRHLEGRLLRGVSFPAAIQHGVSATVHGKLERPLANRCRRPIPSPDTSLHVAKALQAEQRLGVRVRVQATGSCHPVRSTWFRAGSPVSGQAVTCVGSRTRLWLASGTVGVRISSDLTSETPPHSCRPDRLRRDSMLP